LEVVELPTWYDVDDHAALNRLLNETAGAAEVGGTMLTRYAAPFTASALARMDVMAWDQDLAAE
jgi:hypothetical protein